MRQKLLLLSIGLVTACNPESVNTFEGTQLPTPGTTTTANAGEFIPYAFGIGRIQFGYDVANDLAVPVIGLDELDAAVVLPNQLTVQLLNEAAAGGQPFDDTNHCEIVLQRNEALPRATWTEPTGAWFAFEVSESTGFHTCGDLEFPEAWGEVPVDHVTKWSWGGGIQPITADTIEIIGDDWDAFEPWVVGGGYWWEGLPQFTSDETAFDADGYTDAGIAFVYQVDPDFNLIYSGGEKVLIPAATVVSDGPSQAYYEIQVARYLTPADRLLESPFRP
ncbi:MAG: hypothetical protein GWP91_15770 [Rhodobacterales bacterium]|nr:hypothetical protein [Rhodobacterales bacterium]